MMGGIQELGGRSADAAGLSSLRDEAAKASSPKASIPSAWQPISTAIKDETVPVLAWFDHDADPYQDPEDPCRLTEYAAIAEGGDFLSGKGVAIVVWRDGYHESDGWESGNSYWVPGGWFAYLNGDAADHVANALFWMPLPEGPASGMQLREDAPAAEAEGLQPDGDSRDAQGGSNA